MAEFEGFGKNPFPERIDLEAEEEPEQPDVEVESVQSLLAQWNKLRNSPLGRAIQEFIEPNLRDLVNLGMSTTLQLVVRGIPVETHERIRAETRGAYLVWKTIRDEPTRLSTYLQEIVEQEKEKKAKTKKS